MSNNIKTLTKNTLNIITSSCPVHPPHPSPNTPMASLSTHHIQYPNDPNGSLSTHHIQYPNDPNGLPLSTHHIQYPNDPNGLPLIQWSFAHRMTTPRKREAHPGAQRIHTCFSSSTYVYFYISFKPC